MHKPLRTLVSAAVFSVIAANSAQAGGFSLYTESSPAMTGNFGAGAAAEGADASIGWYNPAGLVLIRNQQLVAGGVIVLPTAKLSGTSTFETVPLEYVQSFSNINAGRDAVVPSFHYALPLGENATFGFSVVSPFGLATDWGSESEVRYQATFTEVLTTNFSPEIGGKITENFSLGAGLDLQYARVKFNRMLGVPTILQGTFTPSLYDSTSYNKGDSFGVGFHAGVLGMFNQNHTRLGLNYQSEMRHTFHGFSQLRGPLAQPGFALLDPPNQFATFTSNDLSSEPVSFPDIVTLSAYHDMNEKIALLGSVVYTGWSTIKTLQLNNVAAAAPIPNSLNFAQVVVNSVSPQNYRDAWRAALGVNYRLNQQLMLRAGGGYDQTPTNDVDRDVRLPDASRWALSIGAHYQMGPTIALDAGYTHLFPAEKPTVNRTDPIGSSTYNVTASGSASAELLGAQIVWTIDSAPAVTTK